MDRGIDLPGDACRVQVICKVPFLNLKDKQVSGRLYGGGRAGKTWYSVNAIRTIVQMTGRAVRSESDWAVTYILDGQFVTNIWQQNRNLIPSWWREGLVWKMKGL
jgi:Rad3-related DNA helicase